MDGVLDICAVTKSDCDCVAVLRPHLRRGCAEILLVRVLLIVGMDILAMELNREVYDKA